MRRSSISDFPLMIVRYFVLFPLFVKLAVAAESWIEGSVAHLLKTLLFLAAAHFALRLIQDHHLRQSTLETPDDESDEFPQRLGLRDS
jgi:hypothetical protein